MNAPLTSTQLASPFSKWFEVHPKLGLSLMDHLYNRLDGAYPHKWRSNFPNQQSIDNWAVSWAEAFEEEGITPNDVKAGLKACRSKYDWPPSCSEFIKACKPSVDQTVAYYEAVNGCHARDRGEMGNWSHPAIYWAAAKMAYDLKNQTYSAIKARWEKALADEMGKGAWDDIPAPMIALPEPGKSQLSKEKAAQMLTELGASGVLKKPEEVIGNRNWANKILARQKAGDKSLPSISVLFARQALGRQ